MANKRSASPSSKSAKPGRTTASKSAKAAAAAKPTPRPVVRPVVRPAEKKTPTASKRVTPKSTARYTPPVPKTVKVSPIWVPILMFACLGLGMLMIVCNYVGVLPASPNNGWLLGGLGLITVGFITATRFH